VVNFYAYDGVTILEAENVKKGGTATYTAETPTRPNDDRHTYKFSTWDQPLTNIQANTDFHPVFVIDTTFAYTVTFKNPDGEVLDTQIVANGDTAIYSNAEFDVPYMNASTTQYFVFNAWDRTPVPVDGADQTYTANYNATNYTLSYSFSVDHYIVTDVSTTGGTGYYVPATYDDGTHGEHPVTTIGDNAFDGCTRRKNLLRLGKNVTTFQDRAFYNAAFSKVTLDEGSTLTTSADKHVLYKGNEVVMFAASDIPTLSTVYTIASGATSIGAYAFNWNHVLESITLPDTVTTIKTYAFYNTYVNTFKLGEGIRSIASNAFTYSSAFTSLTLPKSLVAIGDTAFDHCSNFETLTFEGTMDDWSLVILGQNWCTNTKLAKITCSDGDVTL
jgi:hypothetical protein